MKDFYANNFESERSKAEAEQQALKQRPSWEPSHLDKSLSADQTLNKPVERLRTTPPFKANLYGEDPADQAKHRPGLSQQSVSNQSAARQSIASQGISKLSASKLGSSILGFARSSSNSSDSMSSQSDSRRSLSRTDVNEVDIHQRPKARSRFSERNDAVSELAAMGLRTDSRIGDSVLDPATGHATGQLLGAELQSAELQSSDGVIELNNNHLTASGVPSTLPPGIILRGAFTPELAESLNQMIRMVANVTESYTSALFLVAEAKGSEANEKSTKGVLELAAVHSLSRELVYDVSIPFGSGLVGWTAENGVRISVCPFEHDASTLLYYSADQSLKSFIALPILAPDQTLLGVLACDSKRSYAFAKVTEKILIDCAAQAASIILMSRKIAKLGKEMRVEAGSAPLESFIEHLRGVSSERELLAEAAEIPAAVVDRDALVVITIADGQTPASAFYSTANQVRVGHRLLELVCRHKRIICSERTVQTSGTSTDGDKERSFLSIPFHVGKKEAGSINLLSSVFESFSASEIAALERVAKVIGKELELFRLREKLSSPDLSEGLMSWEHFVETSKQLLSNTSNLKRGDSKRGASLIRIVPDNIGELEDFLGVEGTRVALAKLARLVEQVKGSNAIAAQLYGQEFLILAERGEGERILSRFERLLERLAIEDGVSSSGIGVGSSSVKSANSFSPSRTYSPSHTGLSKAAPVKVTSLISRGLSKALVSTPHDGETLEELLSKTNRLLDEEREVNPSEVIANASNW